MPAATTVNIVFCNPIGKKYGAINAFFDRNENNAQALPPKPKPFVEEIRQLGSNFPLRLYCYRISEKIVVLFGGGIKDARSAQESELSMKFQEAQLFAKKIEDALRDQMIVVTDDGYYLQDFNGEDALIL